MDKIRVAFGRGQYPSAGKVSRLIAANEDFDLVGTASDLPELLALTIFNSGGYYRRIAVTGGHEVSRWRRADGCGAGPPGAGAAGRRGDDRGRGRRPGGRQAVPGVADEREPMGAENLRHQAIFVNHAPGAVAPLDPELIQIRDAVGELP